MVPSACSDECARGAEGEAKAACAISKPRPGPRSTLAHALHRYLTDRRSPRARVAHLSHLRTQ